MNQKTKKNNSNYYKRIEEDCTRERKLRRKRKNE